MCLTVKQLSAFPLWRQVAMILFQGTSSVCGGKRGRGEMPKYFAHATTLWPTSEVSKPKFAKGLLPSEMADDRNSAHFLPKILTDPSSEGTRYNKREVVKALRNKNNRYPERNPDRDSFDK